MVAICHKAIPKPAVGPIASATRGLAGSQCGRILGGEAQVSAEFKLRRRNRFFAASSLTRLARCCAWSLSVRCAGAYSCTCLSDLAPQVGLEPTTLRFYKKGCQEKKLSRELEAAKSFGIQPPSRCAGASRRS